MRDDRDGEGYIVVDRSSRRGKREKRIVREYSSSRIKQATALRIVTPVRTDPNANAAPRQQNLNKLISKVPPNNYINSLIASATTDDKSTDYNSDDDEMKETTMMTVADHELDRVSATPYVC